MWKFGCLVMLCSRVMTCLSEVGTIFLYLPLLKLQKCNSIQMFTTFLCLTSETSYLGHDLILGRRTFSEILGMTSRNDVMWQHVAYFCQFSSIKCWRQQKIFMVGQPYVALWAGHYESFQWRGQPLSHHKWFTRYQHFEFLLFFADVINILA